MDNTIIAYAAGLFDGEGSIDIYKASTSKNSKSISLMLRVIITQKDGKIMHWLKDNFGGHVQMNKRPDNNWIYHWDIRSKAAETFINAILPFVKIKQSQLLLAIEFQSKKSGYLTTLKGKQKFRKLTEEELNERLEIKEKIKKLKKEYTLY